MASTCSHCHLAAKVFITKIARRLSVVISIFFPCFLHTFFFIQIIFFFLHSDYDTNKTVKCSSEYVYDESRQRSLQHFIEFEPLPEKDLSVVLPSGAYAACGFQIRLVRKTMQYLVQVYLPSCMFVVVSWVSFLIKPEVVPGRMALLVTLFLVLINIFNSVRYVSGWAMHITHDNTVAIFSKFESGAVALDHIFNTS